MYALSNYFTALSAVPEGLFLENVSVAMALAEVRLPDFGSARLDWMANEIVVDHLETAARRLHELDGRLPRPPVHSLYYRLFGGAAFRPAVPNSAKESSDFLRAAASLVLNREIF